MNALKSRVDLVNEFEAIDGNNYQVLDGLKVGDRIAITGLLKLSDGAVITPES